MIEEFSKGEDYIMRDDVIIFSTKLSQSGHNIKDYRKKKEDRNRRTEGIIPNSTECTYNQNNYVRTIDISDRRKSDLQRSEEKIRLNMDKMPKRTSITAGNTRRRVMNNDNLKTQIKLGSINKSLDTREHLEFFREKESKQIQNNYSNMEKKFNKGPLKEKYLESWLNAILLETCYGEKFDLSIENPALKKYSLDRNSLLSKGIKVENLNRIYKSLFVYSIGFNNLVKEICGPNMNLKKTLWKVYAILLQYCAEGQFQTMIAEIERDKKIKMDSLKDEIEKRQKIIENNEEINEEKNARIFKEIKFLKDENENLANEKAVLMEEFKQAEQAFNQQVSLRLKFENKINEIHGVYTEIKTKHERLINDNKKTKSEAERLQIITKEQSKKIAELTFEINQKHLEIGEVTKEMEDRVVKIVELEEKKSSSANEVIDQKNTILELQHIIKEKDRFIEQHVINLENANLLYENERQEHKIKQVQFEKCLQENNRLHETIQDQMKQLNVYMLQKRDFGLKTSEVETRTFLIQEKLNQKNKEFKELCSKYEEIENELRKSKTSCEYEKEMKLKHEKNLEECYENIKSMKLAKNTLQQTLDQKMKQISIIDDVLDGKDKEIYEQAKKIEKLTEENSENLLLLKTQESKLSLLKEKLNSEIELSNRKFNKLKEEKDEFEKRCNQNEEVQEKLKNEMEKLRKLYDETFMQLKNEKFERGNLDLRYKQSLTVMESENEHIKQLNIKMSELNEEIMSQNRKLTSMEFISTQKQRQYKKEKNFWETQIKKLEKQNKQRKLYISPMVFEDAAANYAEVKEKYLTLNEKHNKYVIEMEKKLKLTQNNIQHLKNKQKTETAKKEKEYLQKIQKKNLEIQYFEDRLAQLVSKNQQLEERLMEAGFGKKNKFVNEQEEKYLHLLKEKTKMVEDLMQQLEQAHDENTKLKSTYSHFEETLQLQEEKYTSLELQYERSKREWEDSLAQKQEMKKKITEVQAALKNSIELNKKTIESGKNQSSRSKSGRNRSKYERINWNQNDSGEKVFDQEIIEGKRNDFAKKYKGAYMYYHK